MAYVYNGALYCDACGEQRQTILDETGEADTGDSLTYPQYAENGGGESDGPAHCDNDEQCLDGFVVRAKGFPAIRIGAFLENPLTPDGVRGVLDADERRPSALTKFWMGHYGLVPWRDQVDREWEVWGLSEYVDSINGMDADENPYAFLWAADDPAQALQWEPDARQVAVMRGVFGAHARQHGLETPRYEAVQCALVEALALEHARRGLVALIERTVAAEQYELFPALARKALGSARAALREATRTLRALAAA